MGLRYTMAPTPSTLIGGKKAAALGKIEIPYYLTDLKVRPWETKPTEKKRSEKPAK